VPNQVKKRWGSPGGYILGDIPPGITFRCQFSVSYWFPLYCGFIDATHGKDFERIQPHREKWKINNWK